MQAPGTLDGQAVLDHYGAENQSATVRDGDGTTEVLHSCLLDRWVAHHKNGDRTPSASLNLDKGLYVCHSSGMGCSLTELVSRLEGLSDTPDVPGRLAQFTRGRMVAPDQLQQMLERLLQRDETAEPIASYSEHVLDAWRDPHPYLTERGLSPETLAVFRIGHDKLENRIVFPHFFEGRLLGWQKRAIPHGARWRGTSSQTPKYRSSPSLPKSTTLYGYDLADHARPAIVVESPASVAMAHTLGIANVVATFGASTSDRQIALLRPFPKVYLWYDADEAGLRGAIGAARRLRSATHVEVVRPDVGMDLGDYRRADDVLAKIATSACLVWLMGPQWE